MSLPFNQVEVDGKVLRLFSTYESYPGYIQMNLGTDRPSRAVTVPSYWFNHSSDAIRTSGCRIKKVFDHE